MQGTRKLR